MDGIEQYVLRLNDFFSAVCGIMYDDNKLLIQPNMLTFLLITYTSTPIIPALIQTTHRAIVEIELIPRSFKPSIAKPVSFGKIN